MYKVLVYDSLGHTATVMNDALSDRCELCCHAEEERFQEEMRARQFDLIFLDFDSRETRVMELVEIGRAHV